MNKKRNQFGLLALVLTAGVILSTLGCSTSPLKELDDGITASNTKEIILTDSQKYVLAEEASRAAVYLVASSTPESQDYGYSMFGAFQFITSSVVSESVSVDVFGRSESFDRSRKGTVKFDSIPSEVFSFSSWYVGTWNLPSDGIVKLYQIIESPTRKVKIFGTVVKDGTSTTGKILGVYSSPTANGSLSFNVDATDSSSPGTVSNYQLELLLDLDNDGVREYYKGTRENGQKKVVMKSDSGIVLTDVSTYF